MDLTKIQQPTEPENAPEAELLIQDGGDKIEGGGKKMWKCKKQIYSQILNQVEFYFSPANLAKDRFMKTIIDKDPCKFLHVVSSPDVHLTNPNSFQTFPFPRS